MNCKLVIGGSATGTAEATAIDDDEDDDDAATFGAKRTLRLLALGAVATVDGTIGGWLAAENIGPKVEATALVGGAGVACIVYVADQIAD